MEDVGDVFVHKTRKLEDFPKAYQELLLNTFRFTSNQYESSDGLVAARTDDTLDII